MTTDSGATAPAAPRRVALAALLVVSLVAGASAIRATEFRPVDTAADPLPADPDGAYAMARANTERASHQYRAAVMDDEGDPFVVEHRIDRRDRQYRQRSLGEAVGPPVYASTGTGSEPVRGLGGVALGSRTVADGRTVRASPDYVTWAGQYDWTPESGLLPPAAVDGWRVADRNETRLVLELADPRAVFAATHSGSPGRLTNVSAARIRAVIDRDRRTLVRVGVRFAGDVSLNGDPTRVEMHVRHEFDVGVDVTRPPSLGVPRPGEIVWRVLVY